MSHTRTVAVLVGSLRKDSISRKLAKAVAQFAPSGLKFQVVEIGDLPHYDQDLDSGAPPQAWTAFRDRIKAVDAVLFVTPEYNRSIPGFLKNAVDVGSRPWGEAAWNDKPTAIISLSMGALGGFGANHHLRQSMSFFNVPMLSQPEAYIGNALSLFDESGELINENTADFLRTFTQAFEALIEKHASSVTEKKAA